MPKGRRCYHGIGRPLWEGSLVLFVARWFVFLLWQLSPLTWIRRVVLVTIRSVRRRSMTRRIRLLLSDDWSADPLNRVIIELWLLFLTGALITVLFLRDLPNWLQITVASYGIGSVLAATLNDVVSLERGPDGRKQLEIRDPARWFLLTLIVMFQAVICFAILVWVERGGFRTCTDAIDSPAEALYFAVVTLTTLGYGDLKPVQSAAKVLVTVGVLTFISLVTVKIAIAAATIRVRPRE